MAWVGFNFGVNIMEIKLNHKIGETITGNPIIYFTGLNSSEKITNKCNSCSHEEEYMIIVEDDFLCF